MRRSLPGPARAAVPHNVEAALEALGIHFTVRDNEALALCPSPEHDDRRPSWSCNLTTGVHNCFSCGFKGSFVYLAAVVKTGKLKVGPADRREASDWSRGFLRSAEEITARLNAEPVVRPVRTVTEVDLALYTWPPEWAQQERGLVQAAVQAYGVLWDDERDAWILPVRDPRTRRLRGWQEKGPDYVKNRPYEMEKADCLFGYQIVRKGKRVIVVESPLDAVRMWSAGVLNVVATYGSNFSEQQILLLAEVTDELMDAFDDDKAGHKASKRLRSEYGHLFKRLSEFDYGDTGAKDPGDMTDDEIVRGARAR